MKKVFVLLIAICILLCGCVKTEPQIDPNLIKIEITYSDSKNITFDIINNSKDSIEYLEGKEWIPVAERTETFFDMMARILASGEKMNFSFDIAARYGELSSGTYRIAKDFTLLNEDGIPCGSQRAFAEFEVTAIER